jgi:hypothetical protein
MENLAPQKKSKAVPQNCPILDIVAIYGFAVVFDPKHPKGRRKLNVCGLTLRPLQLPCGKWLLVGGKD